MIKIVYLLAFSCRTPSCHNWEYESPWDSRHSGSLGGLKCLPFLYDRDPINEHVLENTKETLFPNTVFHTRVNKTLKGKKYKYKQIFKKKMDGWIHQTDHSEVK